MSMKAWCSVVTRILEFVWWSLICMLLWYFHKNMMDNVPFLRDCTLFLSTLPILYANIFGTFSNKLNTFTHLIVITLVRTLSENNIPKDMWVRSVGQCWLILCPIKIWPLVYCFQVNVTSSGRRYSRCLEPSCQVARLTADTARSSVMAALGTAGVWSRRRERGLTAPTLGATSTVNKVGMLSWPVQESEHFY